MAVFRRCSRGIVCLFFAMILLMGWLTLDHYGSAWDDVGEMNILRMTLKEYDALLPFDTPLSQALEEMPLTRLSENTDRDRGLCLYYPLANVLCRSDLDVHTVTLYWRAHTWLIFTAGLFALYAACRQMGLNRLLGCIAVAAVLLSPRFFAAGHYNNKDIALWAITLIVLWQAARLMKKPTIGRAIWFGLAGGAAANTRLIGYALFGLCGVMIILHLLRTRALNRRAVLSGLTALGVSVLFYLLLTPVILSDPAAYVAYLTQNTVDYSRWTGVVLFLKRIYPAVLTKQPRIYLPVVMAATTPLWIGLLVLWGSWRQLSGLWRQKLRVLDSAESTLQAAALCMWLLPLAGGVLMHVRIYNGWRHVYFLYGPMMITLACGLQALWQRAQRTWMRRGLCALLAACMGAGAIGIAVNHPYEYAYCSPLVPTENRSELFELDYWNLSCADALSELMDKTEGTLTVAASDRFSHSGLSMAQKYLQADRILVTRDLTEADYVLSNLSYAFLTETELPVQWKPVVTLRSYGADVTVIFDTGKGEPQ